MTVIAEGIATDWEGAADLLAQPERYEPVWNPIEGKWEL